MSNTDIKRARFVRVAELRVNEIITKIHALSSLHKNTMYDSTQEDLDKIISALLKEIDWLKAEYAGAHRFSLDSYELPEDETCGEILRTRLQEEGVDASIADSTTVAGEETQTNG